MVHQLFSSSSNNNIVVIDLGACLLTSVHLLIRLLYVYLYITKRDACKHRDNHNGNTTVGISGEREGPIETSSTFFSASLQIFFDISYLNSLD